MRTIRLDRKDNVLVLPDGGGRGESAGPGIVLASGVPAGHKIASRDIAAGEAVVKYGHAIGSAAAAIKKGEWVHEHNVITRLGTESEEFTSVTSGGAETRGGAQRSTEPGGGFWGFRRATGRAGVRNDIWVIPSVGCINGELRALLGSYRKPRWIDGVKLLEHPYGCSQLGGDLENTADILAGLADNPNAACVLVVGLGCENLQLDQLTNRAVHREKLRTAVLQEEGTAHIHSLLDGLAEAAPRERELFPLSDLCVGVKCGGSDGYSGLTANPLVGRFADALTAAGGVILATEIPEMFGAESVIAEKIVSKDVYKKFNGLDGWFRDFFTRYGQPIYENPSPGNRAGGITTLEEKSLGAVEKIGRAPVTQVLKYGEQIKAGGGVQICFAPGNDLVSCTALAGSGAQIILFTTGRGTPYGCAVPTVKISTNTPLAEKFPDWIDFDAGALLSGVSWEEMGGLLNALVMEIAGGRPTAHEKKGSFDIAIFKDGVTL